MSDRRRSRSHTKSGPGRYHGQCAIIEFNEKRILREPKKRLQPAIKGGNWQGVEYLTLAEHDYLTTRRMLLQAQSVA